MSDLVILSEHVSRKIQLDPLSRKFFLSLIPPDLSNNRADVDRVRDALPRELGFVRVPLELMNHVAMICRQANWRVTATLGFFGTGWSLIDLEPGDTVSDLCGIAVDIGTTTVVIYLIDMNSGDVLRTVSDYNGQLVYGEDVLTRICTASTPEGLEKMRRAILSTLNRMIDEITDGQTVKISAVTVAANTAMVHFLLGLDPSRICMAPYIPVVNSPGFLTARDVGLDVNPHAPVYVLPGIGSYVGGDVIGGVLASGMCDSDELSLFVDIGTNGEIVMGNRDWLVACAGAAGPALEGGVAHSGMRAAPGAINRVQIEPDTHAVRYETIGGQPPRGICGSGLVDCLAQLFLAGIVDRAGKFKGGRDRFVVVPAEESATGSEIAVTQVDIDNLMRTKGAVNAALELLLESVGCDFTAIQKFYAAGAFGNYLDLESAVTIGIYPDLPRDKMVILGNAAGEGARLVLLSNQKRLEAEEIASKTTYFELNASEAFMNKFVSSKFLPHTNLDYFPTVKAKLAQRGLIKTTAVQ